MPKFDLANYLLEHSIRLRRNNWSGPGGAKMLAEEIYSMMNGIEPTAQAAQAKVQPTSVQGRQAQPLSVPPITFPTFDPVDFDLDFPESPMSPPPTFTPARAEGFGETLPGHEPYGVESGMTGTAARQFWKRQIFPGQVISADGGTFEVRIWKNGMEGEDVPDEGAGSDEETASEESFQKLDVDARCVDSGYDPFIHPGDWVWVMMVAHYTEYLTIVDGIPYMTELAGDQEHTYYWIMAPEAKAGLGHVTGEISAASGGTPGEGEMTIKYFSREPHEEGQAHSTGEGEWVDGESVTVYNSTSATISPPEDDSVLIQWKLIGGLPFIDVEDCSAGSGSGGG